jgi:ATP-dependent Lhr-like helicase
VAGYVGEQFARPEAIDALRAARRSGDAGEAIDVAAYDPLHLAAKLMPGTVVQPLSAVS